MIILLSLPAVAQGSPTCANLVAVRLMEQEGVADCDTVLSIPSGPFSDCDGLTANACATALPTPPGSVGNFEVHYLPEGRRCADGSRAYYLMSTDHDPGSHDYVIRLNGSSGKCNALWDPVTGTEAGSAPQTCLDKLLQGRIFTSAPEPDVDISHVGGILDGAGALGDKVRVWIPSCNGDNYRGNATLLDQVVSTSQGDVMVEAVYLMGHTNVRAVLTDLQLPDDAQVTLVGTSGGSGGLTMILDDLAGFVTSELAPQATVTGILDSNQQAGLGAFEAYLDAQESPSCTVYDGPGECATPGVYAGDADRVPYRIDYGGVPLAFDRSAYENPGVGTGSQAHPYQVSGAVLDESCRAFHAADGKPCRDPEHVRNHHLSAPILVVQSMADTNLFGAGGSPNPVRFAAASAWGATWEDLLVNVRAVAHVQRSALWDFHADRGDAHGDALGVRRAVWATREAAHELTRSRPEDFWLRVDGGNQACVSVEDAVVAWIDAGLDKALVSGRNASNDPSCSGP